MSKYLRVSICAFGKTPGDDFPAPNLEGNVQRACDMIRQSAATGADLVVLPEVFALPDVESWPEHAEPLDGFVITALSEEARRLKIGLAAGHLTREDGRMYNSIVLLDRKGDIGAVYHKTFPVIWELGHGISPGPGALVADTEFGRLGFAICNDLNYAEMKLEYRNLKPDLILFCSAFRGGLQTRCWAHETRSYLVSSCLDPKSVIVNPLGRVIAETDLYTRIVTKTINLDYEVLHYDYNWKSWGEGVNRFGGEFDYEWAEPEGVMLVTALGNRTVRSMMEDLGWEGVEEYYARVRMAREQALAGKPVEAGPIPWKTG
ncbi:MAG: carbon-nitrogen hydrolase family protein [Armatimonadetes bacterium]|nr:carbon-nitrogen hydrolase family protein [Armatimonadota bacterium]